LYFNIPSDIPVFSHGYVVKDLELDIGSATTFLANICEDFCPYILFVKVLLSFVFFLPFN